MGPGVVSECGAWRAKGDSGGSKQPVLPSTPCNSILGHELGERQARAAGAPEAPQAPLLLLDDVAVLVCY